MCYAVPGKVIKISGDDATIDYGGVRKTANISLLKGSRIGDYVLVHAGFAIQKVEKEQAELTLKIISENVR